MMMMIMNKSICQAGADLGHPHGGGFPIPGYPDDDVLETRARFFFFRCLKCSFFSFFRDLPRLFESNFERNTKYMLITHFKLPICIVIKLFVAWLGKRNYTFCVALELQCMNTINLHIMNKIMRRKSFTQPRKTAKLCDGQ